MCVGGRVVLLHWSNRTDMIDDDNVLWSVTLRNYVVLELYDSRPCTI